MALSEAKKAADKRYTAKLDNIMVRPYREEGSTIRAAAAAAGMSVQAYVLRAVRAWMERERTGAVPAGASPAVSLEKAGTRDMPPPEDGLGISAGSPEEGERLPWTLEDEVLKSRRNTDETVDDWRARLSQPSNRSRTIKAIKRITETPRSGDKNDE